MYILLVYERELSQNDYLKTTNNNYKKHQKVNKINSEDHPCETRLQKNKRPHRQLLKGVSTSFCRQLKSILVLEYVLFCKSHTAVCS